MPEKLSRKEKIAQQKKTPGASPQKTKELEKKKNSARRILGLLVAILGFVLYSNTFNHGYVLDDNGLIVENTQTKQGIKKIPEIFKSSYRFGMNIADYSLYRPLSKAMFAAEWELSPNNPSIHHWVNVLLYSLLCYLIFITLSKLLQGDLFIPFVTSLLFAAHPLHTEVVANIKSRDEIVCLLLVITACFFLYNYVTRNSTKALLVGVLAYFIALFSKESAITFLAVVPLIYYFFTNAAKQKYILTIIGMGLATVVFLIIRRNVLGNTESLIPIEDNSLVAIKNIIVQRANAIYIFGHYLLLMIYPVNLIVEGSYNHFKEVVLTSWKFLLPFVILVGGGVYAVLKFKKKDIISFSILYFLVTASLVSNVVILIGTNYGERLMFIPSLGICLLFAVLLSRLFKMEAIEKPVADIQSFLAKYIKPLVVVMVIVLLFGIRTMARNMDWKDDFTLYQTDIKKVPDSAHLLFYVANHITSDEYLPTLPDSASREKARMQALSQLSRAIEIFPKYADAYQRRGFIYNQMKKPDLAEKDYREALVYNPTHPIVYNNYGTLCFDQRRYDEAKFYFQQAVKYNSSYAHALNNLASTFGVFGMGEAEMAAKDPSSKSTHEKLARENFETAISYFKKSINADPQFGEPYRLASVTFRNLGDQVQADKYDRMYKEVTAQKNAKN